MPKQQKVVVLLGLRMIVRAITCYTGRVSLVFGSISNLEGVEV
jgi:hypothetical protein